MKILFTIDSMNIGGAERSLTSLLSALDGYGHDISLWIRQRGGDLERLIPKYVHIIEDHELHHEPGVKKLFNRIAFSIALRTNKRRKHLAEVLWQSRLFNCSCYPKDHYDVAIAYQQGVPTYITADFISASKKITWINANLKDVGYNIDFNSSYYKKFDSIVAVSEALKASLIENKFCETSRISVINDVSITQIIKQLAENRTPTSEASLTLTTVARLAWQKGYDMAIKAAAEIRDAGIDFKWFFVGDGPERANIERMIADNNLSNNITLVGSTPNPYPYMKACDIYVQPSYSEGFGITLNEAKILCKPIITTCIPTAVEHIKNGVNGLTCDISADALANAIIELNGNTQLKEQFAKQLAAENKDPDISAYANSILSLIQ